MGFGGVALGLATSYLEKLAREIKFKLLPQIPNS